MKLEIDNERTKTFLAITGLVISGGWIMLIVASGKLFTLLLMSFVIGMIYLFSHDHISEKIKNKKKK